MTMSLLSSNIKYLRNNHKLSQAELSTHLSIPRSSLSDYERGHTQPSIDTLIKMCEIFEIQLDEMVKTNLSHGDLEITRNKELRVLAISIDSQNRNNIELVDTKAEAGYLEQFKDPEYIRDLPKIFFPNIPQGTYRGFEISGDSMLPLESGSIVICSYVERLDAIKDGKTYVVISKDNGLVYKRVKKNKESHSVTLISDNEAYLPYAISFDEIAEMWEYYAHLGFSDKKVTFDHFIEEKIKDMHHKISDIHQALVL